MFKLFRLIASHFLAKLSCKIGAANLGDNATLDQAGGPNQLTVGLKDARVKANVDSYTIAGTEGAGDTIDLGAALPKDAIVLAIGLQVSAAQSSLTYQLGDDADADRYAAPGS